MDAKELGNMPAYPSQALDGSGHAYEPDFGLTKREAFAMAAMQGLLASGKFAHPRADGTMTDCAMISRMANIYADAQLEELAKTDTASAQLTKGA